MSDKDLYRQQVMANNLLVLQCEILLAAHDIEHTRFVELDHKLDDIVELMDGYIKEARTNYELHTPSRSL